MSGGAEGPEKHVMFDMVDCWFVPESARGCSGVVFCFTFDASAHSLPKPDCRTDGP